MVLGALSASVIAGLGGAILIAVINSVLAGNASAGDIGAFIGLCIVIPTSAFVAQFLLVRLTEHAAYNLRIQLARQICAASYRLLEELGTPGLLATITEDIRTVTGTIATIPFLITQLAILAGCLVYLGWLSRPLLGMIMMYMVLGLLLHRLPLRRAMHYWQLHREEWGAAFRAFEALTQGIKELKLNRSRRSAFFAEQLEPPVAGIRRYSIWGYSLSVAAGNGGQILFYIFIGLVVFLAPHFIRMDHRALTGYILVVLFMISPITYVVNTLPNLGRAHFAAEKITALGVSFAEHSAEFAELGSLEVAGWQCLELVNVTHTYRNEGAVDQFYVGPINLTFGPGEIVFVIGGNGSGKTTLAKLIMGLYEPDNGAIRLDGKAITVDTRDQYRQHFAVVFADCYVFERLLGIDMDKSHERALGYLAQLRLDRKVKILDGRLSTVGLSQGQRKRLALLTAYLEDRPIYIFDEWASDQDPAFKEVFYRQLLPELKAAGKTLIVISHDTRYYDAADRIIKIESGQIESDQRSCGNLETGRSTKITTPVTVEAS